MRNPDTIYIEERSQKAMAPSLSLVVIFLVTAGKTCSDLACDGLTLYLVDFLSMIILYEYFFVLPIEAKQRPLTNYIATANGSECTRAQECAVGLVKGDPGDPGQQGPKGEMGSPETLYAARNCKELLKKGVTMSDWYTIFPNGEQPLKVLCDMNTEGGGWIVLQRRMDGSVDFNRDWKSYKMGFGSRLSDFWLGNDNIHQLTSSGRWELRVDLQDYELVRYFAKYSSFRVLSESEKYKLLLGGFAGGDAGDSLSYHHWSNFSTMSQDNDRSATSCADTYKGGWWFDDCQMSNLNGLYLPATHQLWGKGVSWSTGKGRYYSYKHSEMKMRPV